MEKKNQLLYFYHSPTSFIHIDKLNLAPHFDISSFEFTIKGVLSIPILWIKQLRFLVKYRTTAKVYFCMFAGYHTVLPVFFAKLFSIPCILVAGGIDSVAFPSVKYGNFTKRVLSLLTAYSFKNCTHIAPISDYLVDSPYSYTDSDFPCQGFRFHIKNLKTPHTVIYNGFETEKWFYSGETKHPNSFLSIAANLDSASRVNIKGVDLILQVAALLPQCSFTIIGKDGNAESLHASPNVKIVPFVPHHQLREFYCSHQFYLQLSMSEGFGNTLAEAMLCQCVPIGSNAGAIPMIIKDTGFILPKKDTTLLLNLIQSALQSDIQQLGVKARNRILKEFPLERRARELTNLINSYLK